jgi:hypothetical protein
MLMFGFFYSLGYVKRKGEFLNGLGQIDTKEYYAHFDRRHNINLLATLTFGKILIGNSVPVGITGQDFLHTNKRLLRANPFTGQPDFDYLSTNGDLAFILGDINNARLPIIIALISI